jgi:hypothetical protein
MSLPQSGFWRRAGCAAAILLVTSSCDDSVSTPAAPTVASITVTVSPSPATAVRCNPACVAPSGRSYPFEASMTVTVQESARIGGNVDFINVSPVTTDGTALPPLGYGADVLMQRSFTNHVNPSGILSFPLAFFYSTGTDNAQLVVNISLQFTDDKSNQLTGTAQVTVADPAASAASGSSIQPVRPPAIEPILK